MKFQQLIYPALLTVFLLLTGCGGGGDPSAPNSVSTNFPYLLSKPRVTFSQNATDANAYDVTVEADGPTGIFSVNLWLQPKDNNMNPAYLDLVNTGGTTWTATTDTYLPLLSGDYYLDSIMLEDGDSFNVGIIKSGWYLTGLLSNNYYAVDQREINSTTLEMLNYNAGLSNISIVNFTLL